MFKPLLLAAIAAVLAVGFSQTQEVQAPRLVSYGLVIDNSKSVGLQFDQVLNVAKALVERNSPTDKTFVVRFVGADRIQIVSEPTTEKRKILTDLDLLFTEKGQSAVLDAVYLATEKAAVENPAASLVLITDGDDRNSFYKREQVIAKLQQHKVRMFSVGLVNQLSNKDRKRAESLLSALADASGGRAFFLESPAEIPGIATAINNAIHF